jgi:hypothetical protein
MLVGKFSEGSVEGFLKEIEVADDGQRKSRAWWKSFSCLDQMLRKEIQEEKEQKVVVEWDFHG